MDDNKITDKYANKMMVYSVQTVTPDTGKAWCVGQVALAGDLKDEKDSALQRYKGELSWQREGQTAKAP